MPCIASVPAHTGPRPCVAGRGTGSRPQDCRRADAVRAERRALMRLDDAALKDMGFNKGQAQWEAGRTFWDVPVDRLRW